MKIRNFLIGLAAAAALSISGAAFAQVTLPQVQTIGPNDLVQVIPNGVPTAQSQYATAAALSM